MHLNKQFLLHFFTGCTWDPVYFVCVVNVARTVIKTHAFSSRFIFAIVVKIITSRLSPIKKNAQNTLTMSPPYNELVTTSK